MRKFFGMSSDHSNDRICGLSLNEEAAAIYLFGQIIDDHRLLSVASSMIFIIGDDHRVCSYDLRF